MESIEVIFYFAVTLGVLVFVHELGHFLAAKISGMRVEQFSIGWGPRAFGKKKGETDYRVSWLPIGGYVKISGMIDESFDTDHVDQPPQPWEFRSKSVWKRMLVISAGVIMNIFLAIFIFWGITYSTGKLVWETTEVGYVLEGTPGETFGLLPGDRILRLNNEPVESWDEVINGIYLESMAGDLTIDLLRGGQEKPLVIPRSSDSDLGESSLGLIPGDTKIQIMQVEPGKPAEELGLQPGDLLMSLNGTPVYGQQQVVDIIGSQQGKELTVEWQRDGEIMSGQTVPSSEGKIGIALGYKYTGPQHMVSYSLIGSFPIALQQIGSMTFFFVQQVWSMIAGETSFSQNVGGPIKIALLAKQSAEFGLSTYMRFMALLSISLAVLNMLPIPGLDGGHFVFLLYEGTFRREIPSKVKINLNKAGLAFLLALMAFVFYNDIVNL